MTPNDESDDELERRMTAKLFGREGKAPTVETRRRATEDRRPKPIVEVEAIPLPLNVGGDDVFLYVFSAVMENGARIRLRSVRGPESNDPKLIIREYEQEGRLVRWASKPQREDFD